MLLLTIFLEGCAGFAFSKMEDHERCIWSLQYQKCRCHMYRVSPEKVGRVSDSWDAPPAKCDKLVGFAPNTWIEYVLWFQENYQAAQDASGKKWQTNIETPAEFSAFVSEIGGGK